MATSYTITSVRQTNEISATGQLVDVVEATFEVAGGVGSGVVRVPKTGDWETALREQIEAEAAMMTSLLG